MKKISIKKLLACLLVLTMLFLVGCSSDEETETTTADDSEVTETAESDETETTENTTVDPNVLDLSGAWMDEEYLYLLDEDLDEIMDSIEADAIQGTAVLAENPYYGIVFMIAFIEDGHIIIYQYDLTQGVFMPRWIGSYEAPTEDTDSYTWESINDTEISENYTYAYDDESLTFTYEDGVLSYVKPTSGNTVYFTLLDDTSALDSFISVDSVNEIWNSIG